MAALLAAAATLVALASAGGRVSSLPSAAAATAGSAAAGSSDLSKLPLAAQATISAALGRDSRHYQAHATATGFRSQNRVHGLAADFTKSGVAVQTSAGRLGLSLQSLGYGDQLHPVAAAKPRATKNRVSYRRGTLTEWYLNGPLGLEQGFTLAAPPAGQRSGPLTLALTLSGTLQATLAPGARALDLTIAGQPASLRYRGLSAWDATGTELPASLALEGRTLLLRVRETGARYPLTIDPMFEQAKLTASDGAAEDWFGGAVAIDGDTAVVGAFSDDVTNTNQGSAYIFVKPAEGWASATETAKLTASDGGVNDYFGLSVAVDGDTVVVGAPFDTVAGKASQGSIYVFVKPAGGWVSATQTAKLTASDGAAGDQLGSSVAINADTLVAGATLDDVEGDEDQGSVYVFVKPATGWVNATQRANLTASDGAKDDWLGYSVAVGSDMVVSGAPLDNVGARANQGSAYVFLRPAGGWANGTQTAKLTASEGGADEWLGSSIAVGGSTVIVGATLDDIGANANQGSVYVFERPGGGWVDTPETAKLTASDGAAADALGAAVSVSAERVVAAASGDDVGANATQGSIYVFAKPSGGWADGTEAAKLVASDGAADDWLGHFAVALAGDTVVAGAPSDDIGVNSAQGSAYIFAIGPPEAPGNLRVTTEPSLPSQILIDGRIANSWGLDWLKLPPGTYTVSFTHVEGYTEPAPQEVTITAGETTTVNATFTQRGSLRVLTSPALAATISVDGIPRNDWGMWTDLPAGTHEVCFGPVTNFTPPACENVNVQMGELTTVTGTYAANAGAPGEEWKGVLRVTTSPPLPSQILLSGTIRDSWGLDWVKLLPGTFTISFTHVEGYTEPAPQEITILGPNSPLTLSATFTQRGSLRVMTSPAVAGTISVDGIPRNDWGMWTDLPVGQHDVCFGAVPGFTTPPCQNVTVNAGSLMTVTGTYS